ncbi:uncharacterized protein [Argopecten irradians]|uniref:uncharacterized protein n=1 Tax=Argopecten irradians TaxID=31199 RepID=UPI0037200BAD
MNWNPMIKTCRGFTKTLTPDTTPTFSHYKSLNVGDGYINMAGMMIKFTRNPMLNWQMAQEYCVNHTRRLVVLDTLEKYNAIRVHPFVQESTNWWVGTRKLEDTWKWTTGQAMDNGIQILEDSGDADCVGFWIGYLSDSQCNWGTPFICEK